MALPTFNMRRLLEAGVHFGHQSHRWNPKMGPYIFGSRNNIHIIDLAQTVPLLHQALVMVSDTVAKGGRVMFVGTKRQASDIIAESAQQCAQYFINHRWLGGTLTNWKTVSNSIRRLKKIEGLLAGEGQGQTKKELLKMTRERNKLDRALGGIKDMGGVPDLLFIVDTNRESLALAEARTLKIPVIAVIDSNCDPDVADYPIPGNDDAGRAIGLYCDLISRAVIDGIERSQVSTGKDLGAAAEPTFEEPALAAKVEKPAKAKKAPEVAPAKEEPKADVKAKAEAPAKEAAVKTDDKADKQAKVLGKTDFEPMQAPDGDADDLKMISGVGPVLEKKLNGIGIFHYRQIAAFTKTDITAVDDVLDFKGRIDRDGWLEQAVKLGEAAAK